MLPHRSEPALTSSREAAAAFVAGTTLGWGRRELAEWLVCHYAPCVVPARGEHLLDDDLHHARHAHDDRARERDSVRSLEETAVEEIIRDARYRALRFLSEIATDRRHAEAIGRLMIATSAVLPIRDVRGAIAYAPMDQPRMRLADRVMSLFVADYLNSPLDYRGVRVCRGCGTIGFAMEEPHEGGCPSVRRNSHIASLELEPVSEDERLRA